MRYNVTKICINIRKNSSIQKWYRAYKTDSKNSGLMKGVVISICVAKKGVQYI